MLATEEVAGDCWGRTCLTTGQEDAAAACLPLCCNTVSPTKIDCADKLHDKQSGRSGTSLTRCRNLCQKKQLQRPHLCLLDLCAAVQRKRGANERNDFAYRCEKPGKCGFLRLMWQMWHGLKLQRLWMSTQQISRPDQ